MNIKLLEKIKRRILKEPRQFQMGLWFTKAANIPNCGTAACIAGWAIAISNKVKPNICLEKISKSATCDYLGSSSNTKLTLRGAKLLQINEEQAFRLFMKNRWPARFLSYADEGTKEFAEIAVKRIDHFIATNGAE